MIVPILFVFMERWRGYARPFAILCCYALCMPLDYSLSDLPMMVRESFLTKQQVEVTMSLGLGMILRPGILILATIALSAATVRDVWHDIRYQGWRARWRYRRDSPLLPGIETPLPAGRKVSE
jgi:hypothetical protein